MLLFELNVCSQSQLLSVLFLHRLQVIYMLNTQWIWTLRKAVKSQNTDFLTI